MVWGWDYGDGHEYVYQWLQRTRDEGDFEAFHARESSRRARLRELVAGADRDPAQSDRLSLQWEAAELGVIPQDASLEQLVGWHFTANLLPGVPHSVVDLCAEAIRRARLPGGLTDELPLPEGVTFRRSDDKERRAVSVAEVIRQHSLSRAVLGGDDLLQHVDRQWDLSEALHAWALADKGLWEIPSPAPSWPEYVTLLLVGRNHLEPGEEDEPGERDTLRGWWMGEDWRWDHRESWWSADTAHLMNLPGPAEAEPLPAVTLPVLSPAGRMTPTPEASASWISDSGELEWLRLSAALLDVLSDRKVAFSAEWPEEISQFLDDVSFLGHDAGALDPARVAGAQSELRRLFDSWKGHPPDATSLVVTVQLAVEPHDYDALWRAITEDSVIWGNAAINGVAGLTLDLGSRIGEPVRALIDVLPPGWQRADVTADELTGTIAGVDPGEAIWWQWGSSRGESSRVHFRLVELAPPEGVFLVVVRETMIPAEQVLKRRRSWRSWLDSLADWVGDTEDEPLGKDQWGFRRRMSYVRELDERTWVEGDPIRSELLTHRQLVRQRAAAEELEVDDWVLTTQLHAQLARALAAQGMVKEAEHELGVAFGGFKEAPMWVPMLDWLTRARMARSTGPLEDVVAHLTSVIRHFPGPESHGVDEDLYLDALLELATLPGPDGGSRWARIGLALARRFGKPRASEFRGLV